MARHATTDTPTRGVVEYWFHFHDGQPSEKRKIVLGPYDSAGIAKRRTYQEAKKRLVNLDNRTPQHWRGWSEIIEIRFERVKECETIDIEFTLP